jgi:hypothetical protein
MDPKETERLLKIIKVKLLDGKLPYNSIPRIWGGPGNGEACDACEVAITPEEFLMEGIATEGGGGVQFHVRCFYLWDALRRVTPTTA